MERRSITREGTIAGLIGATTVALWFLIVDSIAGHAFFTPAVLGAAVYDAVGLADTRPLASNVALYTLIHFAVFVCIGIVATTMIRTADRRPSLAIVFLLLFVAFEVAFFAATAVLARSPVFGHIAWYQFGAANLLAAILMGRHIWLTYHPQREQWLEWVEQGHGLQHR